MNRKSVEHALSSASLDDQQFGISPACAGGGQGIVILLERAA